MLLHERYELGERIAEGAHGTTLLAHDRRTGEDVIVRRVALAEVGDWTSLEEVEREAKILRALDHPAIPRFVDAFEGEHEGKPAFFVVAQRVEGETLAQRIDRGARWSSQQARAVLTALLETLVYLHELSPRVIHCDIKPDNIVFRAEGAPVLVGFGSVQDPAGSGVSALIGTPGYMAPEQALGRVDPRSDLYSLAATMVHALTHRPPLSADGGDPPSGTVADRVQALAGIDQALSRVLERMLDPDPGQRFSSARAVLAALEDPRRVEPAPPRPSLVLLDASAQALVVPAAPRPLTPAVKRHLDLVRALQTMNRRSLVTLSALAGVAAIVGAMARVMWLVPVLLFGVMVSFVTWPIRARNAARDLYAHGHVTRGQILESRPSGPTSVVIYRFDVGEHAFRGEMATSESATVHSVIVVFYDPNDPRRHTALLEREIRALS
jgi:serine/threonine protein kinase